MGGVDAGLASFAGVDEIEELVAAFAGEVETVGAALELAAPAADEFAFLVKDEEGIASLARPMDGVGYVEVALSVFADAVGIAEGERAGQTGPVVDGFVGVGAAAEHGPAVAGFRGGVDCGRGGGKKGSAVHGKILLRKPGSRCRRRAGRWWPGPGRLCGPGRRRRRRTLRAIG